MPAEEEDFSIFQQEINPHVSMDVGTALFELSRFDTEEIVKIILGLIAESHPGYQLQLIRLLRKQLRTREKELKG